MTLFNPSRDQVRRFFCDTFGKYQRQQTLDGAEHPALAVILLHPEYHALLGDPERALAEEWTPERGQTNPFLHLSLHLAIEEQLSIDQPPGIREAAANLARTRDDHAVRHLLLEALGETIWAAQQSGRSLDPLAYLEAIRRAGGVTGQPDQESTD